MTAFDYPALFVGDEGVADSLEEAFQSSDVQVHVQRGFYLERAKYGTDEPVGDTVGEHLDEHFQIIFVDATSALTVDDRVASIAACKERCPGAEVVIIIGPDTQARIIDFLHAGAWYFLEMPIHSHRVAMVLVRLVAFREADSLVRIDKLTGLYNRAFFEDAMREQIVRMKHNIGGQREASTPPVSLIVADLDHYLDAFGDDREKRDEYLREVAGVFRKGYRVTDTVARIGGDEFAGMMTGVNFTLALMRAEILRKKVAAIDMFSELDVRPTLSIGTVTFPSFFDDPGELYLHARRGLSRAKGTGGDTVFGFDNHGTPKPFGELGG